ncbi:unnamed protein product [Brassica oleracea var. botrytis]
MIDYGGKMHDLQDRFSKGLGPLVSTSFFFKQHYYLSMSALPLFKELSVMVLIEDMFYLINMVEPSKESNLGMQLTSIQKLFSSTFPFTWKQ